MITIVQQCSRMTVVPSDVEKALNKFCVENTPLGEPAPIFGSAFDGNMPGVLSISDIRYVIEDIMADFCASIVFNDEVARLLRDATVRALLIFSFSASQHGIMPDDACVMIHRAGKIPYDDHHQVRYGNARYPCCP